MSGVITIKSNNTILNYIKIPNTGHLKTGTDYGKNGVDGYIKNKHGPDGALFLDPHLDDFLRKTQNKKVLDIGCGVGPCSIQAALYGAEKVIGFDIQELMIIEGQKLIRDKGLADRVTLMVGDASQMPSKDEFFHAAISVCVACNLPNGIFEKHFQELARVLNQEGEALIIAPTSLNVLFTDGTEETHVLECIHEVLAQLPLFPKTDLINETFKQLPQVLSATFAQNEQGKLFLVRDLNEIKEGQQIWRKLPFVTVPNFYHSDASYLKELQDANLKIDRIVKHHFVNEDQRQKFNEENPLTPLGKAYIDHPPFALYYVKKD